MPKNNLEQSINQMVEETKTPPFDKEAIKTYYKQFGDGFTDDAYELWAEQKGKKLGPKTPFDKGFAETDYKKQHYGGADGTYADQYLNDEEFLREAWETIYPDVQEYQEYLKSNKK